LHSEINWPELNRLTCFEADADLAKFVLYTFTANCMINLKGVHNLFIFQFYSMRSRYSPSSPMHACIKSCSSLVNEWHSGVYRVLFNAVPNV